jgi:glutathione S-transferase
MSLRIRGRPNSINVRKVVWTARELELPFERIDAGGAFGGNRTPEYLRMNPNGKIPAIDDDGFVLWESNAIVRYPAATHGGGALWPHDPRQRADADRRFGLPQPHAERPNVQRWCRRLMTRPAVAGVLTLPIT